MIKTAQTKGGVSMPKIEKKVIDRMTKNEGWVYCPAKKNEGQVSIEVCKICKMFECKYNRNPNNKKENKMEKENKTYELKDLFAKLENIEAILSALVKNKVFQMPIGAEVKKTKEPEPTGKRKMSKKEKDAVKAELLKGAPYGREGLVKIGTKKSRMYASALKLNVFGKGVKDVQDLILAAEKKVEPKKVVKKAEKKVVKK